MANPQQVKLLKQSVIDLNKWRETTPHMPIDLKGADLMDANLDDANLSEANLRGANLTGASLVRVNFIGAYLFQANLNQANLSSAILRYAHLYEISLSGAILRRTNFCDSIPRKAYFGKAQIDSAIFGSIDLSDAVGLDEAIHLTASVVSTDTLRLSKGKIPVKFLRGCGLSDWEIESAKLYNPDLSNEDINGILYRMYEIRAQQPLQISPLFISYSHADSSFVDKLEKLIDDMGIRFWRDIHHATAGRLETQIDRAIRQNPTVVLILSQNSIKSDWVQHEVRKARELEKELGHDILCPIALDDSWQISPWPERVMEQVKEYNILDFSLWKDDSKFKSIFGKLIDGLNLYYKKP